MSGSWHHMVMVVIAAVGMVSTVVVAGPALESDQPAAVSAARVDEAPDALAPTPAPHTAAPPDPSATSTFRPIEPPQESLSLGAPPPSAPGTLSAGTDDGGWMLKTLTALGVVIALIFALRFMLQRMGGRAVGATTNGIVEVLGRTNIGPKTQVLFLKLHQRVLVVAQSPSGFNTLTCLDDPEEVAWVMTELETARPTSISQSFRHLIDRFDRDYQPGASLALEGDDTTEHDVDRTRDGVNGLRSRMRSILRRNPPEVPR